jgi:hypothetical protein
MTYYHFYFYIIMALWLTVVGFRFLLLGLRGLFLRKCPVYVVGRNPPFRDYLYNFLVWMIFITSFGIRILDIDGNRFSPGNILLVLLISGLLTLFLKILPQWRIAKTGSTAEVVILGINKKVLDLIRQALGKEGIAFDETHEDFALLELNARIYTTIWSGIGYATLKIDPKEQLPILEKIIQFMKAYDNDHSDHFSCKFMILEALCGLVLAGAGIVFAYLFLQIVIA